MKMTKIDQFTYSTTGTGESTSGFMERSRVSGSTRRSTRDLYERIVLRTDTRNREYV